MRYIITSQNKSGQWIYVDTVSTGPDHFETWANFLERRFGPGKYNVILVQEDVPTIGTLSAARARYQKPSFQSYFAYIRGLDPSL